MGGFAAAAPFFSQFSITQNKTADTAVAYCSCEFRMLSVKLILRPFSACRSCFGIGARAGFSNAASSFTREEILDKALSHVLNFGWTEDSIARGAMELGYALLYVILALHNILMQSPSSLPSNGGEWRTGTSPTLFGQEKSARSSHITKCVFRRCYC
jgi:hypothetical protein